MPKFLLQKNGNPVGCNVCGQALDYPAIQIPDGPPVFESHGERLGRWMWNYLPHCVRCAFRVLKKLKPSDLQPVIKDT